MPSVVKTTSVSADAWAAGASKSRLMQRMGYDPRYTTAVIENDHSITLTQYDTLIEAINTVAGTGTMTAQSWDAGQDKNRIIQRLGLPDNTAQTRNANGTVSQRAETTDERLAREILDATDAQVFATVTDLDTCLAAINSSRQPAIRNVDRVTPVADIEGSLTQTGFTVGIKELYHGGDKVAFKLNVNDSGVCACYCCPGSNQFGVPIPTNATQQQVQEALIVAAEAVEDLPLVVEASGQSVLYTQESPGELGQSEYTGDGVNGTPGPSSQDTGFSFSVDVPGVDSPLLPNCETLYD